MGEFFVKRPIVAMVIAIVMVIVGLVSMTQLPIEQYPALTPPMVEVSTNYVGANALNVEQSVATPLEQKINGVENMIYMKSTNTNSGYMTIHVSFRLESDPNMNSVLVQNRVATVTQVPAEVKQYGITTEKTFSFPLLVIAVTSPNGTYDRNFIGNYARINLMDELGRLYGVGKVNVIGVSDYAMRIWIKPDRVAQLGLTIPEIVNALKEQNRLVPGGKFGGEPAPPGTEYTYTVNLRDRLKTPEEFGNVVLRTNPDGSQIRLKHVADVEMGTELYEAYTRLNGKDCALIFIYQAPGSNAMEVAGRVKATMERLAQNFPDDMTYAFSLDTTRPIVAGLKEIVVTLLIALLLVILVVYIFLQDWRATLIPTMAIPVSLVAAFIAFPFLGFSINTLSLLGLVLAIGIVVDDAIVVVEAVTVYIEKGLSPAKATIQAMKDVTAPVIATTLVLVAVFVPVVYISGITGRLYQQFAITIAVSVMFSSLNALTLSPALCSLLLRKPQPPRGILGKFFSKFNRGVEISTEKYLGFASIVSRKIKRSLIFIAVLTILILLLGKLIPGGFVPEEDQGYFMVNIQLPSAASLQRTLEVVKQVEGILKEYDEIEYNSAIPGYSLLINSMATNNASVFVTLKEWDERSRTAKEVINALNEELRQKVKRAVAVAFGPPAIQGLGTGSGFSIMIQDKGGNTVEYLAENTRRFIEAAQKRPEIGTAFTTFQADVPQRFIDVNTEKVLKAGVALNDLYTTLSAFLGGMYVNDFNRFGRLYKVYMQADNRYRQKPEQLQNFFVKNKEGKMVPLSTLLTVKSIVGPEYTTRFNLFRSVEVMGSPAPGYSSSQAMQALREVAAEVLPADMDYAWNAMSYQEDQASGTAAIVFAFSLLFVFLILAAQYESWSLPFAILLGTPFAIFGAFFFLLLARLFSVSYENNIFAQISLVMLIAMAAKNAILIVEFAKMRFDEGRNLFDAAMEAAKQRFRPILMTAFSFILGIIPLLVATGAGAEARKVMGMTLFGGMLLATVIGVFMYPMLFIFIGKIAKYEQKRESLNGAGGQLESGSSR